MVTDELLSSALNPRSIQSERAAKNDALYEATIAIVLTPESSQRLTASNAS